MKNNLIIGGCYNYSIDQVWTWAKSIKLANVGADKVLIVLQDEKTKLKDEKIQLELSQLGFKVIFCPRNSQIAPHVDRFFYISDFLRTHKNYEFVLTTDVRDVILQSDPFVWINNFFPTYPPKLVVSTECLTYENEPWGNQNLYETFGPYIHSLYKNCVIYNVGVLYGNIGRIQQLCQDIAIHSLNRPIQICDQAVFNYMMYNSFYGMNINYMDMNSGWCAHLGTTMDHNKIDYFKPNLLETPPHFDDNDVLFTDKNIKFCIVHQYDRTKWRDNVIRKYS